MKVDCNLIAVFFSCLLLTFVGCSKDEGFTPRNDDDSISSGNDTDTLLEVKNNQIFFDNNTYDIIPSAIFYNHRYCLILDPIYTHNWSFWVEIDSVLTDKAIDLSGSDVTLLANKTNFIRISIPYVSGGPINYYIGSINMTFSDGKMKGHINEADGKTKKYYDGESIFKYGTLQITKGDAELLMNMKGVLKNNTGINLSYSIPIKDIRIIIPHY